MKKLLENPFVKKLLIFFAALILFILLIDNLLLPWYVSSPEVVVPSVIGKDEAEATRILENEGFTVNVSDTSFGEDFPQGQIFLQKPDAGNIVKKGRDIYIFISGGEQYVAVPSLKGKTIVDAKFSLERVGLKLGSVEEVASNYPKEMIFDQQFVEGTSLKKGELVGVTLSSGSAEGTIYVPDLIGKSLTQARIVLNDSSLVVGKINYQISNTLLPNTVLDQYPSPGNKLNAGEKVDLFITKTGELQSGSGDSD